MAAPTAGCATLTSADSALVSRLHPSPNFGHRRGRAIDALVLHYTGMASGEAALKRLCDPAAEVSCHYLVWEDGRVDQLVAEAERAWHAGRGSWAGETDVNSVSVGVEIVNGGHADGLPPYPDAQVAAVIALCRDICGRRAIAPARVLAHSDLAPARKEDPGERFPWDRLAGSGVALSLPASRTLGGDDTVDAAALLRRIGYDLDGGVAAALRAFQRRWRQHRVDGIADAETVERLRRVADASA